MRNRSSAVVLGGLLFAVASAFCVATLLREHDRVSEALGEARPALLALGLVSAEAAMISLALGWRRCFALLGIDLPGPLVARWYFAGELGKYVPGGIWPILGRAELASRGGVERRSAYRSVGLSLVCWYAAAALPAAIVATRPGAWRAIRRVLDALTARRLAMPADPPPGTLRLVLSYLPTWALVAATTAAVVTAYGQPLGWRAPAVAVVAWVVGFLAVPVPAGAGIREAVFVSASGLPTGIALVVAITARLCFVTADLLGAAIGASWQGR